MKIEPNAYAVVDYVLLGGDDEMLDDSRAEGGRPIRYVHGYGMLVPGLEARLAGMYEGDEKEIVVPAAEAYGEHDDELVYEVDRGEIDGVVEEGDELLLEDEDGDEASVYVVEVRPDAVVVDGNHPLAGMDLRYRISVREVRAASEDEIQRAAAALESVEPHVHGPGCSHDEDVPQVGLFDLARKKNDLPS